MNIIKNKTYLNFILYFIFYGVIIAVITSVVSYNLQFADIEKKINDDAKFTANEQKTKIEDHINNIELSLYSIVKNPSFLNYLERKNPQSKHLAQNIFLYSIMANENFFQLRFINTKGKEVIRIDKDRVNNSPLIISGETLQDKSQRYYFKESIKKSQGTYWRSNIDLNVEHKEIERPLRPTLRVSTSVYHQGELHGIVIINVDLTSLLKSLKDNTLFDIYIVDKDGYFLIHPNNKNSWSKYLKSNHTIKNEFPNLHNDILEQKDYASLMINTFNIEDTVQNNENLMLLLYTQNSYIDGLKNNNYTLTLYLAILILIIAIPLGIIIAINPARLQDQLNKVLKENSEQLDIIDKSVITSTTDLEGKIVNISSAMANISGYKKEELIGKKHSILKSGKMSNETYKDLWDTIKKGMVWNGEVQNKTKENNYFWLKLSILPHYDINNALDGYISIAEDATDKKAIEYISEHDKLTTLNNRARLDFVLEQEFFKSLRYSNPLSIILIDIDYFKKVNDEHGHLIGDMVLIELSNIIKKSVRKSDTAGRWGGEEFLIIATETDLNGALQLAENLRKNVDEFRFKKVNRATISIGVAELEAQDTIETILKRADDNLYKAKDSGRNCIKF